MKSNKEELIFDQEKLEEMYDDMFWRVVMGKYVQVEGEKLSKLNEEIKDDPHYQMSAEANQKIFKMIDRFFRKRKMQTLKNTSSRIFKAAGMIVLVFAAIFTVAFFSVDAFRIQVLNFVVTYEKEYTSVKFGEGEPIENITAGLSNIYAPTYIPKGYRIDNIIKMDSIRIIEYINDEGDSLEFQECDSSAVINIDTENAETVKSIKINGSEGLFVLKNENVTISWAYDNQIFVITAQISEDEIVKIAESIIFIK